MKKLSIEIDRLDNEWLNVEFRANDTPIGAIELYQHEDGEYLLKYYKYRHGEEIEDQDPEILTQGNL